MLGLIGFTLAVAILWDICYNDGDAIANIIKAIRGKKD